MCATEEVSEACIEPVSSITVIVKLALPIFPEESVAVHVMVLVPRYHFSPSKSSACHWKKLPLIEDTPRHWTLRSISTSSVAVGGKFARPINPEGLVAVVHSPPKSVHVSVDWKIRSFGTETTGGVVSAT